MATRDPEKRRATRQRYLTRKKVAKYGADAAGVDMRGRHGNHARGDSNGRWNPGRLITSQGYIAIRVPKDHHRAWGPTHGHHRYAYEHDLVAEQKTGRRLSDGEIVHHIDGDRWNNDPANLTVETRSDHARAHGAAPGARDRFGRFAAGTRRLRDRKGGDRAAGPEGAKKPASVAKPAARS